MLSVVARSGPGAPSPDLFLYALLGRFDGYFPGYSSQFAKNPNCLTWVVLKAHTSNTAGEVTLRSPDPRVPPQVNFRYFDEGNDSRADEGSDLQAVVAGVALARKLTSPLREKGYIAKEEVPGDGVTDETLAEFVRDHAWGHHASCTCRIGRQRGRRRRVERLQGARRLEGSAWWTRPCSRGSRGTSSRAPST